MRLLIIFLLLHNLNINTKEEVKPIYKNNTFTGIKNIITIESNQNTIKVNTSSIKHLLFYTSINKDDKYIVDIAIDNKNYKYINNTLKIKKYKYDNTKTIYRTINTPLKKLYDYQNINLEDKVLDKKLKENGYKGIEELDEYYKDYYNCNKLTYKELKEIIKGRNTYIKESNFNINKLAYNYYYKNVFKIKKNNLKLELSINKKYYTAAYEDYPYDLNISFYLKKIA